MPYADPERQREYMRNWIAARRAAWLEGKSCVVCGSQEDLEVDHIDRMSKVDHRIWSWAHERREAELVKCQVLCQVHHKEKTRHEIEAPHGTHSRYCKHGCRCLACKAAHAKTNREWRQQRRRTLHLGDVAQ